MRARIFSRDTVRIQYDHEVSRWGLPDFLVCVVLFIGVSVAMVLLTSLINGSVDTPTGAWLVLAVAVPPLAELLYVMWAGKAKGRGIATDFGFTFERGDLRLGLNLFLMAVLGAIAIVSVWTLFAEPPTSAAIVLAEDSSSSLTIWIVLFAIAGATLIPVIEELVFRGLLWSALEKRGHGEIFTLIVTSAIFSLIHLEPARSPILFFIGLAMGIGRLRTGRIGASIVTHITINSLAMIGLLAELS